MSETAWETTKKYSTAAYTKALKPGLDKVYQTVENFDNQFLSSPASARSQQHQHHALEKDSITAADILKTFFHHGIHIEPTEPSSQQGLALPNEPRPPSSEPVHSVKLPSQVIHRAKGLAIFTASTPTEGLGVKGSGILVGRNKVTGEWTPPSGIALQTTGLALFPTTDVYEVVLVINAHSALEMFSGVRCTLGDDIKIQLGPLNMDQFAAVDLSDEKHAVWTYTKSEARYAAVSLDGLGVLERARDNQAFYQQALSASEIMMNKVNSPLHEQHPLLAGAIRIAQGEEPTGQHDEAPATTSPGLHVDTEVGHFGIPAIEDPDPYGVKALQAEGLQIREAGSQTKPPPDTFNFSPVATSPIYPTFRKSMDMHRRANSWRKSTQSVISVDRATQTTGDDVEQVAPSPRKPDSLLPNLVHKKTLDCSPYTTSVIDEHSDALPGQEREQNGSTNAEILGKESSQGSQRPALDSYDRDKRPEDRQNGQRDGQGEDERENKDSPHLDDVTVFPQEPPQVRTAIPVVAKARVVTVPKRAPPTLPPRNPNRVIPGSNQHGQTADDYGEVSLNGTEKSDETPLAPPTSTAPANIADAESSTPG